MKYRVPHFFPVIVSIAILGCCFAFLMKTTFTQNQQSYKELLNHLQVFEESQDIQAKQERSGVSKEIWYAKNGRRLLILAQAKNADVYLEKVQGKNMIIERLEDATAIIQEEYDENNGFPLQKLKKIQAKSALYNYTDQSLIAQDVVVEEFIVHGDRIPKKLPPSLHTVRAQEVELKLETGNLQVSAGKVIGVSGK